MLHTGDTNSIVVTITAQEASHLWHTGVPLTNGPHHFVDRFEALDENYSMEFVDDLLESGRFDTGSILWTDSYLGALLLAKVLRAGGFESHVLGDTAGGPYLWAVLTTRPV